jgi:hypothetical protein
MTPNMA